MQKQDLWKDLLLTIADTISVQRISWIGEVLLIALYFTLRTINGMTITHYILCFQLEYILNTLRSVKSPVYIKIYIYSFYHLKHIYNTFLSLYKLNMLKIYV